MKSTNNTNAFGGLGKLAAGLALVGLLVGSTSAYKERTNKILSQHIDEQITLHLKNRISSHESLNLKKGQSVLVIYEENGKYILVEEAFSEKHFEFPAYRTENTPGIIFVISGLEGKNDSNYKPEDKGSIIDVNFI